MEIKQEIQKNNLNDHINDLAKQYLDSDLDKKVDDNCRKINMQKMIIDQVKKRKQISSQLPHHIAYEFNKDVPNIHLPRSFISNFPIEKLSCYSSQQQNFDNQCFMGVEKTFEEWKKEENILKELGQDRNLGNKIIDQKINDKLKVLKLLEFQQQQLIDENQFFNKMLQHNVQVFNQKQKFKNYDDVSQNIQRIPKKFLFKEQAIQVDENHVSNASSQRDLIPNKEGIFLPYQFNIKVKGISQLDLRDGTYVMIDIYLINQKGIVQDVNQKECHIANYSIVKQKQCIFQNVQATFEVSPKEIYDKNTFLLLKFQDADIDREFGWVKNVLFDHFQEPILGVQKKSLNQTKFNIFSDNNNTNKSAVQNQNENSILPQVEFLIYENPQKQQNLFNVLSKKTNQK